MDTFVWVQDQHYSEIKYRIILLFEYCSDTQTYLLKQNYVCNLIKKKLCRLDTVLLLCFEYFVLANMVLDL